jgi:enamine deaminase RidA (YjgF/YER057c/UK114 family)
MKKTVVKPLDRPFARAVGVERPDHTRVYLSGAVTSDTDEGLEAQTRETLAAIEALIETFDGHMTDLVRVRVYANETLTAEAYEQINAARRDFFPDETHYPASTVLEVTGLVNDDYRVEIEADAIVPEDGWDTEIIE